MLMFWAVEANNTAMAEMTTPKVGGTAKKAE
jgi:hypothetical protein